MPGDVESDSPMMEMPLAEEAPIAETLVESEPVEDAKPKTRRRPRARKDEVEAPVAATVAGAVVPPTAAPAEDSSEAPAAPKRRSRAKKVVPPVDTDLTTELAVADAAEAAPLPIAASNDQPAAGEAERDSGDDSGEGAGTRRGWWQRTFG